MHQGFETDDVKRSHLSWNFPFHLVDLSFQIIDGAILFVGGMFSATTIMTMVAYSNRDLREPAYDLPLT